MKDIICGAILAALPLGLVIVALSQPLEYTTCTCVAIEPHAIECYDEYDGQIYDISETLTVGKEYTVVINTKATKSTKDDTIYRIQIN